MQSTENKTSGLDGVLPAVDLEHPGFFPFARFSLSSSRSRQAGTKPLSQSSDFAVWPNAWPTTRSGKPSMSGLKPRLG